MKALSLETTKLLDKMYNLRGNDSVVLKEMDKQKNSAEETYERTTTEKQELQTRIANLETQHEELESQGAKLKEVLSGIDKKEFATVLERLDMDFDPEKLLNKVSENLPKTIDEVSTEMKDAEDKLVAVEEEMNNAITTIEELEIRKDAALANQDKLNEYFDLALTGKINIPRDSITTLLEHFDFTEEERREAAKILMFPEDALYSYNEKVNNKDVAGKSISDVISEAKDAVEEEQEVEFQNPEIPEEEISEEQEQKENTNNIFEEQPEEALFNPFIANENLNEEKKETSFEEEIFNPSNPSVSVEDYLNELGLNYLDFTSQDLDDLKKNYDQALFKTNVDLMTENTIDLDIFVDHAILLYDKELSQKVQILLNIGKEPIDIYLNPSILAKYTVENLKNAIELLTSNGMDPKNVPLMAY